MASSLPFPLRVAAGLVAEAVESVKRLPTDLVALPVTVAGRAAKLSFQLNQQLTDLAVAGDRLIARAGGNSAPPERTAWSTIDEPDEVAVRDPQAAPRWDSADDAADDGPPATPLAEPAPRPAAAPRAAASRPPAPRPSTGSRRSATLQDVSAGDPAADPLPHRSPDRRLLDQVEILEGDRQPQATLPTGAGTAVPSDTAPAELTLAQLRGRLRSMSVEQVRAALQAEELGRARPAFLTLLTNRLSTLARTGE